MRLVQTAIGLLLLSVPVGACTIFDARSDCTNNPWGCEDQTTTSTEPQSCLFAADCSLKECYLTVCKEGACVENVQNDVVCAEWKGLCNNGTCELLIGSPCQPGDVCQSGSCVDGFCCNAECGEPCMACNLPGLEGTCSARAAGESDAACADTDVCSEVVGFCQCDDGKKNGDETDVDCGGGCGGTCTTGLACLTGDDCASSNPCVDGVCCNKSCDLECGSCNLPDLPGLCSTLIGEDASMCSGAEQCNADQTCLKANGQTCASDGQCASGQCLDGFATCAACDANVMCPPAKSCLAGVCVSNGLGNGTTCVDGVQCASAHCVDGVCCDQKCDGFCMGCHQSYTDTNSGTCAPISKGLDPHNECSGPGAGATCSGDVVNGAGACGENPPQP